jgi:hypothetical protein
MNSRFKSLTRGVALLVFGVTVSSIVHAQTDVTIAVLQKVTAAIQKLETSCSEEIKTYCSTVTPGEGRILHCMQAHEDKIGTKCAFDLRESELDIQAATEKLQQVVNACRDDILRLCANTQPGQGRIAACLATQGPSISQTCATAVKDLQSK